MMSGIRGRDTRPEMLLRKGLHRRGFRYRLHLSTLPGRPDMVFPRYRAVLFVHGCFWHVHACSLFRWPSSREDFWRAKLERNRANDQIHMATLAKLRWRVGIVWECALKGRGRLDPDDLISQCADWLRSGRDRLELAGYNSKT